MTRLSAVSGAVLCVHHSLAQRTSRQQHATATRWAGWTEAREGGAAWSTAECTVRLCGTQYSDGRRSHCAQSADVTVRHTPLTASQHQCITHSHYPHTIPILSPYYPNTIPILSPYYPHLAAVVTRRAASGLCEKKRSRYTVPGIAFEALECSIYPLYVQWCRVNATRSSAQLWIPVHAPFPVRVTCARAFSASAPIRR